MLTLLRNIMVWSAVIEGLKGLAQAVQVGTTPTLVWTYPQANIPVTAITPTRFVQNGFAELFFYPDGANKNNINVDCISVDVSGNLTIGSKRILSNINYFLFNAATFSRSPSTLSLVTTTKFDYPNSSGMGVKTSHYIIDDSCTVLNQTNLTTPPNAFAGSSTIIFQNTAQQIISVPDSTSSFSCDVNNTSPLGIVIDVATGNMSQQNTLIPRRSSSITPTLDGFAFTSSASLLGCSLSDSLTFSTSNGTILSSKPLNRISNCALTSTQAGHTITLCIPSRFMQLSSYPVILSVYSPNHSLLASYTIKNSTNSVEYDSPSISVSETNAAIYALWTEPVNTFPIFHAQPFTLDAKPIAGLPEITFGAQNTLLKFGSITALDGANVLITYFNDPSMLAMKLNWPNPAAVTTTTSLATLLTTSQQSLRSTTATFAPTGTEYSPTISNSMASTANTPDAGTTPQSQTSSQPAATPDTPADVVPGSTQPTMNGDNLGMIIGIAVGAGLAVSSIIMFIVFFLRHQRKSADHPELATSPVARPAAMSIYDRVEIPDPAPLQNNQYTPGGVLQARIAERNASYDALGQRLGETLNRNGIFMHKSNGAADYSSPPPPQNAEYHSARVDENHYAAPSAPLEI